MRSQDLRLRAICLLLVPGFVGHTIQLLGEDLPWADWARLRYWTTPGWHLFLPQWVPLGVALALGGAVAMMAARRTRPWMAAVIGLYLAHYLTYPFRIRNHMSLMFAELTMLGGCWLIGALSADAGPRDRRSRRVDGWAVDGMAAILCITYAFAALHKLNDNFVSLDPARSAAVHGLDTFFVFGDLGHASPTWARRIGIWGTIVIEAFVPLIAWRVTRLRVPAVILLMLFHFPHVAVMDVADYPMIASAFYPALFSRGHLRLVLRHAHANRWTLAGAGIGVLAQLWFMPFLGSLTGFGLFVMGLWGFAAGAMLRAAFYAPLGAPFGVLGSRLRPGSPGARRRPVG